MKVVYPKNIQKGMFVGMTFSIGPLTISVIQLFILAIGIGGGLGIFNLFAKSGSKFIGIVLAILIIIIFLVIAFFKMSELSLIPFMAKFIRNNFFDTKKKYQENYNREDPINILIKEHSDNNETAVIERKTGSLDKERLSHIEEGGLL